jgi:ribonucleoside-diphosphate reductase alpha chain
MTRNPEIPIAKSLVDYIFRWLAMEFVPGYRANNAPQRPKKVTIEGAASEAAKATKPASSATPVVNEGPMEGSREPAAKKPGNGHAPRLEPDAKPFDYGSGLEQQLAAAQSKATETAPSLRLSIVADPLSQQGTEMQADAPACDVCGSITVRSGTCYKCLNCGNSMGCS